LPDALCFILRHHFARCYHDSVVHMMDTVVTDPPKNCGES
jgi:hypothetical protein